jgi:hypothetical protein
VFDGTMNIQVIGFLVAIGVILVVWFAFVAPSERRYHEKKLKLLQERIEKREQHVKGRGSDDPAQSGGDSA